MDINYNINKLNDELNKLFKNLITDSKKTELEELLSNLLHEQENNVSTLNKYSKNTLKLMIERNILISMEDKVLKYNKSYLNILKNSKSKFNINILHHYFDTYIDDIKNNNLDYNNENTIEELKTIYNDEIRDSFKINDNNIQTNINNISSIELNHMENLNANGRTISVDNNGTISKKGGIFLDKNSNVGYGKFVNKNELFDIVRKIKTIPGTEINNISVKELKIISKSLTQTIKIDNNNKIKNQDARIISVGDKKAGSMFLGKKGINLPNGEYISLEEITFAVNKFIDEKKSKPKKFVLVKNKFKYVAAIAGLTAATVTSLSNSKIVSAKTIPFVETSENKDLDINSELVQDDIVTKVVVESNCKDPVNEVNTVGEVKNMEQSKPNEIVSQEEVTEQSELNEEESMVEIEQKMTDEEIVESSIEQSSDEINQERPVDGSEEESMTEIEQKMTDEEIVESSIEQSSDEINQEIPVDGSEVVHYAMQFVGNPYVYGGNSLTDGIDCSGFTSSIYSNFGIDLPRTSSGQRKSGENLGTDIENALPGDIICFEGHVGLYIGNGQMIHAANSKKGIVINDVNYDKPIKAIIRPGMEQTKSDDEEYNIKNKNI